VDLSKLFSDPYLVIAILAGACIVFPQFRDFLTNIIKNLLTPAPKQVAPIQVAAPIKAQSPSEVSPFDASAALLIEFASRGDTDGLKATVEVMRKLGYVANSPTKLEG